METLNDIKTDTASACELTHKTIGGIRGRFVVPDYQRGYRWDKHDVTRLLDDIWDSQGQDYCLQPIVVKLHLKGNCEAEHEWELVDGQQRLKQSQIDTCRIANQRWPCCFSGYETETRALVLKNSGLQIQCVDQGWQLSSPPPNQALREALERVCATFDIGSDLLLAVPQNAGIDTADRVIIGGNLLASLVTHGL